MIEIGSLVRVKDNYPVGYDDITERERERHGKVGTVVTFADGINHTYNDVDFPDGSIGLFRDDELEIVDDVRYEYKTN